MRRSLFLLSFFIYSFTKAQENYEIQVYGSQTQAPKSTIFELHSNYTFDGEKEIVKDVLPSHHSLHETVEITTGITDIFEIGFYFFTNYTPGHGYHYVGSHIRPRVMAPAKWNWPVGVSLSTEFGYQKAAYSEDTWNIEIRPIVDKQWEKLYISFNPALGIALKSKYNNSTPVFEPNLKISYAVFKNVGLGIEYYGDMGPVNDFNKLSEQGHTLFVTYDLLNNMKWEVNLGPGFGLNAATDNFIFKILIGRRIKWK